MLILYKTTYGLEFEMKTLDKNSLAVMEFELNWQSSEATHCEFFFAPNVNMWRDIFPADVEQEIYGSRENETFSFTFKPGDVVPGFSPRKVEAISPGQVRNIHVAGHKILPQFGRFYPSGLLQDVPGIFPQTLKPFRVIGLDNTGICVDLNDPLSLYDLELTIRIHAIQQSSAERGGRCTDWLEELTRNGPGMQARFKGRKTVFESMNCYKRYDQGLDSKFYTAPRLVGHIDAKAGSMLQDIYAGYLHRNDRVLDLMSSVQSHLPRDYNLSVTGLGLNRLELRKNPILNDHLVHDLNETPLLPFSSNTFDAVVCSLSIEYLTRPREIISEMSRVLVPGGKIMLSFSNRWFPAKVTQLWLELHDFERMGLVLDYLLENNTFSELCTFSARNWPRPADDRHAGEIAASDPVFVVAGIKKLQ
jgi:SAM-dependent methyltransferase